MKKKKLKKEVKKLKRRFTKYIKLAKFINAELFDHCADMARMKESIKNLKVNSSDIDLGYIIKDTESIYIHHLVEEDTKRILDELNSSLNKIPQ